MSLHRLISIMPSDIMKIIKVEGVTDIMPIMTSM